MRVGLATMAAWLCGYAGVRGWLAGRPRAQQLTVEFEQTGKPVAARFESFAAEIAFDPKDLAKASVVVTVDLGSLRTGDGQRDQMAVSSELLAAASGPTARYRDPQVAARGGDRYEVEADLTLKGVTRPLIHPATISISGGEAHAQGEVVLARTDFGVGSNQFPRGDQIGLAVTVRFDLIARRQG